MSRKPIIWIHDYEFILERIQREFERAEKAFENLESPLEHVTPDKMFLTKSAAEEMFLGNKVVEFGARF
jgi:hypothetical protein